MHVFMYFVVCCAWLGTCACRSLFFSLCLTVCLLVCLSVCLSVCVFAFPTCICIYRSKDLSIDLSVYLFIYLCVYLSIDLSSCLSTELLIYVFIGRCSRVSIYRSIDRAICPYRSIDKSIFAIDRSIDVSIDRRNYLPIDPSIYRSIYRSIDL